MAGYFEFRITITVLNMLNLIKQLCLVLKRDHELCIKHNTQEFIVTIVDDGVNLRAINRDLETAIKEISKQYLSEVIGLTIDVETLKLMVKE